VNKWDINSEMTARIETVAEKLGATIAGRIPYDRSVTEAQVLGQSVVEFSEGPASKAIQAVWRKLCHP